jgi:hypothetical protein
MHTLNHTLEEKVLAADGSYLEASELRLFEQYLQSYTNRLEAYQTLRDKSSALVVHALRRLAQAYPELVQKHGQRCQYDMMEVLRYIALSILRDDETFFKEQVMSWLDTVLLAHKKNTECSIAYRHLLEAVTSGLSPSTSSLIYPYLNSVLMALQSHA